MERSFLIMGFSITGKELWIIMVLPQLLLREQIEKNIFNMCKFILYTLLHFVPGHSVIWVEKEKIKSHQKF
ncbi:unnamed protein product [Gulo gulo]|uniref:Uncharacterized protein n=1 Tax=Gulo gulo TaxID=48420 RepID=A0A9X9PVD0_GULGU|nr:unnamed protein product [Gulo gulo]